MSTTFGSSIDVGERLKVVRTLSREALARVLANPGNERLQASVIKAVQSRLRRLNKEKAAKP